MEYIVAFDGGGTKTRMIVGDLEGHLVYDKITTGSNITSMGDGPFKKVIGGLFEDMLIALSLRRCDIKHIYLGLSGADLESDYKRLNKACKNLFKEIPFTVTNDAWIILRSGLNKPYGAVCICGTGTNSAAINKLGHKAILRSLSYILGTYGGGLEIAREALHYAYRADELTYRDTILKTEIPKLFGRTDMTDCVELLYPIRQLSKKELGSITPLVMKCAMAGDEISIKILKKVARHIALQTVGVIKQVEALHDTLPVVVGGRVFDTNAPVFIKTFTETLLKECPKAYVVKPQFHPVVGAYLFALDLFGIEQTKEIEMSLKESGGCLS